jgi:predicted membrane-bound spermidine synthase
MSLNYSADLFGSAIGAFVTTLLLLPFLGLVGSCLVMVFLNFLSAGFLHLKLKKV